MAGVEVMTSKKDIERRLQVLKRQGWCPVPYRHHPKPIKDAIRCLRFRPQLKQCYRNAQLLFLSSKDLGLDLKYMEGWCVQTEVGLPFEHAWLIWQGQIVDLTLMSHEYEYQFSVESSVEEVREFLVRSGGHRCIKRKQLVEHLWGPLLNSKTLNAVLRFGQDEP